MKIDTKEKAMLHYIRELAMSKPKNEEPEPDRDMCWEELHPELDEEGEYDCEDGEEHKLYGVSKRF